MTDITFPNETTQYRAARAELLRAEADLRRQTESVAAMRRNLPPGGTLKEDYVFQECDTDGNVRSVRFSELFAPGQDSLFLYGFMYGPEMEAACPLCTAFLDPLNGAAPHLREQINVAVVARSPIERVREFAKARGWDQLRMLSSAGNTYHRDYLGETSTGSQMPMGNVFVRDGDTIRHFWGTEMLYGPSMNGADPRHLDIAWPLWNILDMTPGGRGNWYPALEY